MKHKNQAFALIGAGALVASLAACGSDDNGGNGGGGGAGDIWTLGTTDTVSTLDPAGSYDLGSSTLDYNLYQTLVTVPASSTEIVGDAATSCEYTDPKTYKCTLADGLKFSNGDALTSSDVKYSFERSIKIQDADGAAIYLLGSITTTDEKTLVVSLNKDAIETPDDTTVIFHLDHPDTTFQYVLTYPGAAAIVDEQVFPADAEIEEGVVGSGPYKVSQYKPADQATLQLNENYTGPNTGGAGTVFIKYYSDSSALKLAVENAEVDVAWRSLSSTDIADLKTNPDVTVGTGKGSEIRYWVWNTDAGVTKQLAVRQAGAQIFDREAIATGSYDGTVDPLYSIVPPGYAGQKDVFQEVYGAPDVDAAKKILADAGISTPVNLTVGWTPTHYGPSAEDEANEVKRQLEDSGLFKVQLKSTEWEQYKESSRGGAYDLWLMGWFPDYPDTDDYLSPFLIDGGFFQNGYTNPEATQLITDEQGSSDQAEREQIFGQLQDITARDVPFIPSWVGQNTGVYGAGMKGVESTLDPSFIFRLWLVTKNA